MFKNYFITAIRNITRNFGYTLINFIGLSFGIALFILINLYVINEYSFDRFNKNYNRIYRLEEGDAEMVHLPSAMGLDAQDWFPEIEKVVRFKSFGSYVLQYETTSFRVPNVMLADSSFFDVFTTEFIEGDPKTAFDIPNAIVLTDKIAKIFFGDKEALNQIIRTPDGNELVVKGIIKEFPNFHIQIDVLLPFNLLGVINGKEFLRSYGTWQFQTYFLLPESFDIQNLENKLEERFTKRWEEQLKGEKMNLTLRPLKDVYFANQTKSDFGVIHGNKSSVKLFFAIGIFIIFIACINFINLTTAKASSRATEVGIRKVHGSNRRQLIFQFLLESILTTFIAFLIAITLVQLLLPIYNNLIQKELSLSSIVSSWFIISSIGGILVIGIIAGIYPSFYLTAFNPVKVLKGEKTKGKSAAIFRRILIILQFTISVALIISTIVVQKQLNFLENKDMGFEKHNIIVIRLNSKIGSQKETFKQKLKEIPQIIDVSYSSGIIGTMSNQEGLDFNSDGNKTYLQIHPIDPAYIDLYEIKLLDGRNFSYDQPTDLKQKIILNEEAVKASGLTMENAVGTIFHREGWYLTALPSKECEIIGIAKNFNFRSLHDPIGPLGLVWNEDWLGAVSIKIRPENKEESIKAIEKIFKEFSEDIPFEYKFIDDHIKSLYEADQQLGKFFKYFAFIAIIIAMLGLFGLAAFIAESRTKEIGIRKALGSSSLKIILMISKEFIKWVLIANVIAIPIAYYGMNKWLQTFAFKTKITPDVYLISALLSIFIALATVFYQSYKAAQKNPSDALRYE